MKNLNMKSKLLLIALVTLNIYGCGKPEVENLSVEKKTIDTTTIVVTPTPPVVVVNDSILYQSDFTKASIDVLNSALKINHFNFMSYNIDGVNNTFTMIRDSVGSTNDEIYNACGALWRNIIPDSVSIVTFSISVDNISHNNDYQLDIWNPKDNTRTSHYLIKGINTFDFDLSKYSYSDFQISAFGKMAYGGSIPYSITISNITVKAKEYK